MLSNCAFFLIKNWTVGHLFRDFGEREGKKRLEHWVGN